MLTSSVRASGAWQTKASATLWFCSQCNAFIAIHTVDAVEEAYCPACVEMPLEFCGKSNNLPGFQFGEA